MVTTPTERQSGSAQDAPKMGECSGPVRVQRSEFLGQSWEPSRRALEVVGDTAKTPSLYIESAVLARLEEAGGKLGDGLQVWLEANDAPGRHYLAALSLAEALRAEVLAIVAGVPIGGHGFSPTWNDGLDCRAFCGRAREFGAAIKDIAVLVQEFPRLSTVRVDQHGAVTVAASWSFGIGDHDDPDFDEVCDVMEMWCVFHTSDESHAFVKAFEGLRLDGLTRERTGRTKRQWEALGQWGEVVAQLTGRAS